MVGPGRDLDLKWGTILKHELDKFEPKRFRAYSDWFFGPTGIKGTKDPALHARWRKTVDSHYKQNLHHAHKIGMPQPLENQLEAITDWYSVGKTNKHTTLRFFDWYKENRDKLAISDKARNFVDYAAREQGVHV